MQKEKMAIKLHVLLYLFNSTVVGKYIVVCKEYILIFRLIMHCLYLPTCLAMFYIGLQQVRGEPFI